MDATLLIGVESQTYKNQRKEFWLVVISASPKGFLILGLNVQWKLMFIVTPLASDAVGTAVATSSSLMLDVPSVPLVDSSACSTRL